MKLIPLNKGHYAQVDDEDFEELSKFRWSVYRSVRGQNLYAHRTLTDVDGKPKLLLMHRVIMKAVKGDIIDHIDRNGLNCQKANLRFATYSQNGANRRPSKTGTSMYLGVSFDKTKRKWKAQITHNKRTIYLGRFHSEIEAAMKYNEAALKRHGEFANVNVL